MVAARAPKSEPELAGVGTVEDLMTTHRFAGQVRRALDLETDAQALHWCGEAVAAYLNALEDLSLRAQMALELPDKLFLAVKHSRAALESIRPDPALLAELLGCPEMVADHLLRVVWTVLQDALSPSDLVRMRSGLPIDLLSQLDRYESLAEEETDALHGDVAVYQYDPDSPPEAVLSGGDVDAAWQDAETSGEETVGGSVITPDQDVVEELGEALGVTYRFDEPLRPVEKEHDRDRSRWEMDPASSEDFGARSRSRKKPGRRPKR